MVRVYRLSNLVLENAMRQVASHKLTFTEFEVLAALRGVAPPREMQPTELYTALLISSGGLTKVLDGMLAKGLVSRGEDKTDRRSKPVRLTPKGSALAERVMADILRSDKKMIFSGLSAVEVERLTRLLRKLLLVLEPV
jgi:DNA-binding MarR family transcriptional regulator